jgi:hypothetical protein
MVNSNEDLSFELLWAKTPQITSSHCGSGVQTTFLRPKSSLKTCTRRYIYILENGAGK